VEGTFTAIQEVHVFKTIISLTATAGLLCLASPAHAAGNGCPPGHSNYVLWNVGTEPYGVDNAVDEQGNNDGWACARPGKVVIDDDGNPFQLYNFIDNRVAAG
jgi:hypothetical protein